MSSVNSASSVFPVPVGATEVTVAATSSPNLSGSSSGSGGSLVLSLSLSAPVLISPPVFTIPAPAPVPVPAPVPTPTPAPAGATPISTGGVYALNVLSKSTTEAAVTITTSEPVTITGSISGMGPQLITSSAKGANITVKDCTLIGMNSNVSGQALPQAILIANASNVVVDHCSMSNVGGYANYFLNCSGSIQFTNNAISNVNGMYSNGSGGYQQAGTATPHALILNGCQGLTNSVIAWNQIINVPGASYVNDVINIYDSSGTSASHLAIHDNYIQGLYAILPATTYDSGCGIITDGTVANETAFIDIYNNQVIGTGNAGIGIAAGHDIAVNTNTVIGCGLLPPAYTAPLYAMNVGIYCWDQMSGGTTTTFFNNTFSGNVSGWLQQPGTYGNKTNVVQRNDYWLPNETGSGGVTSLGHNPTPADETAQLTSWTAKLASNSQTVGAA